MATIVRLDKVKSTAHLVNFTFATDLENGRVVALGDLQADGETYTAAAPADATADRIVLHATVPMGYVEPDFEEDFVLKAGVEGRGYILERGDIITLTDDAFSSVPVKNDVVTPANASTQLGVNAVPAGEAVQFKAIAKETLAGQSATVLEVL